ncbi:MAG: phosphoglycerate mutase family protein [Patescibacteria group bacterium]
MNADLTLFVVTNAAVHVGEQNPHISEDGRKQAKLLGQAILIHINGSNVINIISSPATRAVDTALILKEILHANGVQSEPALWDSAENQNRSIRAMVMKIEHYEGDVLILVGHKPFVSAFPTVYGFEACIPEHAQGVMFKNGVCTPI